MKRYIWKKHSEYEQKWDQCNPCNKEAFQKTIVEEVYIEDESVKFHYRNPILLKLVR
jgi:hypothetical protein